MLEEGSASLFSGTSAGCMWVASLSGFIQAVFVASSVLHDADVGDE